MEYKEFSYDDLFELLPINNKLSKNNLSKDGTTPVLSSDTTNNGIVGYTTIEPNYIVDDTVPVYVVFGDHTRTLNITTESFCVMDNVKVLKPKTFNISQLLYICSVWKKAIPNLGYARHWSVAKKAKILLPITSSGEPNYAYMEQYMNDIEQEVINELKTQSNNLLEDLMKETGISSIELTAEGKELLNRKVEYGEFKVGELFKKIKTNPLKLRVSEAKKKPNEEYNLPALTSGVSNQGLTCYVPRDNATILRDVLTIASNGDAGKMYYQEAEFTVLQDAYAIECMHKTLSKYECLYFLTVIEKQTKAHFNWNNKATWDKVKNIVILLPITSSGEPDYDYMESYMKLQEKLLLQETDDFVVDLEEIIENQMKNIYKRVHHCTVETYGRMNEQKSEGTYTMFVGSDLIDYPDLNNNMTDPTERMRDALLNKHIGMTKFGNALHLYIDEKWTREEIQNFINKAINQKDIIDAINSGELKLKIDGLKQENSFNYQKIVPYYDWRALKENGWNVFAVIDSLKAIGIDIKLGER